MNRSLEPSEESIQSTFVQCLAYLKPRCVYLSVPNEGKRTKSEAARLKRLGMVPGATDMLFLWGSGSAVIEFKRARGRLSKTRQGEQTDAQIAFEAWCKAHGVRHALCRDVESAITKMVQWKLLDAGAVEPYMLAFKEGVQHASNT